MKKQLQIVYLDTKTILSNSFLEEIKGEPDTGTYQEVKTSVQLFGITSPFILSKSGVNRSQRLHLRAALELGIKKVPCIIEDDSDELIAFQNAMGLKNDLLDKYRTLIADIKERNTAYSQILRYEILGEAYNLKQGDRCDLRPDIAAAIAERNRIVCTTYRTIINRILDELSQVFGNDKDARNAWIKAQGNRVALKKLLQRARTLVATNTAADGSTVDYPTPESNYTPQLSTITKPEDDLNNDTHERGSTNTNIGATQGATIIEKFQSRNRNIPLSGNLSDSSDDKQAVKFYDKDKVHIFNVSCFEVSILPDNIDIIITSPPYWLFRPLQKELNNPDEIGNEDTDLLYADRLSDCFVRCIPKLRKGATIYVILADKLINGAFTLAPELFAQRMIKKGFKCIDRLWYNKTNVQPGDGENSSQNVEYIYKFCVVGDRPYTNYSWLNQYKQFAEGNTMGVNENIKMTSFIHLPEGFIKTSVANTAALRTACKEAGFYLKHNSTYLPEIPYAFIRTSARKHANIVDLFNGCGNSAVACLYANLDAGLSLNYYGTEISDESVKASWINIEKVHGFVPKPGNINFKPNEDDQQSTAA